VPGPDIFLSYNREDAGVAKVFADAFMHEGLEVWWDQTLHSGETYDEVTELALRNAKAVVVLWSPRSVASHWVRAEATIAHRSKTLIPATIEPCDKPVMFELTQTAELSHWKGDATDKAWCAFLDDVRRMVGVKSAPLPVTVGQGPGTTPRGRRPALAILPFVSRSGLVDDDDFADDLVADLIAELSFSPWMEVVAPSTTAAYREPARNLRLIGQDLAATYLLEGKIRGLGGDCRVTVQLAAADDGKVLWTRRFDAPFAALGEAQDALVTEISASLGSQVERIEQEHALRKSGGFTAWECFMRAVANVNRATRAGYEATVVEAQRAQRIDPEFPLAYAVMLAGLGPLTIYRDEDPDHARMIIETIRTARSLAPDDPTVLAGCVSGLNGLHRPLEALPFAERAVAINPNVDYLRGSLARVLVHLGRLDEALAEFDAEERLAADSIRNHDTSVMRSVALMQAGRLDEARNASDRAVRLLVSPESLTQRALCLAATGDLAGAREAIRRICDADSEISRRDMGNLVRYFHFGSPDVGELVRLAHQLWDETGVTG
jgi:TolB-like protein